MAVSRNSEPMIACDEMEAAISRLRDLLDAAESYNLA
jgi:hypothetical protein